jgi:hypothetical protein
MSSGIAQKGVTTPYRGMSLRIVAFSDWRVHEMGALTA